MRAVAEEGDNSPLWSAQDPGILNASGGPLTALLTLHHLDVSAPYAVRASCLRRKYRNPKKQG